MNDRPNADDAARTLFEWLALRDTAPATPCDAVIGFGHFDLNIPRRCAELQRSGAAKNVIFTGGIGAGSADLGEPEADAFFAVLTGEVPPLRDARVIVENRSTNTAENIGLTRALLERDHPELAFGQGIRSVLLVANPCRQRRVWLTWRQMLPDIPACNAPPLTDYEEQARLYAGKRQDIARQVLGEFERIRDYPDRGWIAPSTIPPQISTAAVLLAGALSAEP